MARANASREPALSDSIYQHRQRGNHDRIQVSSSSSEQSQPDDASNNNWDQSDESQSSDIPNVSADNSGINKSDQGNISAGDSSGNTGDQISLSDYLGTVFCTGCEKHCSLLALRCDRGLAQLEAAQQEYQAIYGSASVN